MERLYFKDLKSDNIEVYLGDKKVADVLRQRDTYNYLITMVGSGKKIEKRILPAVLDGIRAELRQNGIESYF